MAEKSIINFVNVIGFLGVVSKDGNMVSLAKSAIIYELVNKLAVESKRALRQIE